MATSSIANITDVGSYAMVLAACLDNAHDLPIPQDVLDSYKQHAKNNPGMVAVMKVPAPLQAIIVEERRLQKDLREFPPTGRVVDRDILCSRLQMLQVIQTNLFKEAFIRANVTIIIQQQGFTVVVDGNWNVCGVPRS